MSKAFRPGLPPSVSGVQSTWSKGADGEYTFKLRLSALSPLAIKSRNFLRLWLPIFGMAYQALILWQYEYVSWDIWMRSLAYPWLLYPICHVVLSKLLKGTAVTEITKDEVSINTGSGWKSFDRNVAHEFKAITHEKAVAENDKRMAAKKRYYQKSRVVALIHAGVDIPILDVFEVRKAERMIGYLKAHEKWLEGSSGRGNGFVSSAQNNFSLQPGGLKLVKPPPHIEG